MGNDRTSRLSLDLHSDEMLALTVCREPQCGGSTGLCYRTRNAEGRGCFAISLDENQTAIRSLNAVITGRKALPGSSERERHVNINGVVGRRRLDQGGNRSRSSDE